MTTEALAVRHHKIKAVRKKTLYYKLEILELQISQSLLTV